MMLYTSWTCYKPHNECSVSLSSDVSHLMGSRIMKLRAGFAYRDAYKQAHMQDNSQQVLLQASMHSSHALKPYAQVMHSSHALRPYTQVMHSSHALKPCTRAIHPSHTPKPCTQAMHLSHIPKPCTQAIHSRRGKLCCATQKQALSLAFRALLCSGLRFTRSAARLHL